MVSSPLGDALERAGVLVVDGAMATELERYGADLSGGLWSARFLLDQPELISRVHHSYFHAGADVAITASYQASVAGFTRLGLDQEDARRLIRRSVELAVTARDEFWAGFVADTPQAARRRPRPLVATSVGPYGAVLADGSEYRGNYDIGYPQLVRFHRERLQVLSEVGVEVLACETIPSLVEATALVEAMGDVPEMTAWVSFSARNELEVSDGTSAAACASFLHGQDQIVAVGINCTQVEHISRLIQEMSSATDKPIVVYPNSGELYDVAHQRWTGTRTQVGFGAWAKQWHTAGARLIGGCCRTRPDDIRAIADALGAVRDA
jgi:homocysteine S-methyltransferase